MTKILIFELSDFFSPGLKGTDPFNSTTGI